VPVRPATLDDLPEIAALIRELAEYEALVHEVVWTEEQLADALFGEDPSAHVLVAETDDGAVVGLAIWFRTFSTFLGRSGVWLEDLFVRPAHRGDGHGRALLDALWGLTDGRVEWAVLDWNEPAIGFYRSIGAHPVEGWTRYRWVLE
jgi:GNAT superfamily N-acetyltransferase